MAKHTDPRTADEKRPLFWPHGIWGGLRGGAPLAETPYRFVRRLSETEIVLAYRIRAGRDGETLERWRDVTVPNIAACPSYVIRYGRRGYRFAGQFREEAPRG